MPRKTMIVAICVAALALGCKKKDEEGPPTPPAGGGQSLAPAGMVAIPGEQSVFITRNPVFVGEYVAFLKEMGVAVPAALSQAASGEPLTGLSAEEATHFAAWHLKRPATAEELRKAEPIIGAAGDRLFLVQDWLPGSPGQRRARDAKAGLAGIVGHAAENREIAKLRGQIEAEIERCKAARTETWKKLKPALFSMIDKDKELFAKQGELAALKAVCDRLRPAASAKLLLRTAVTVTGSTDAQIAAATKHYGDVLATQRAAMQKAVQAATDSLADVQKQVMDTTGKIERAGEAAVASFPEVTKVLELAAKPPANAEQAQALKARLEAALAMLEGVDASLPGFPTLAEVAASSELTEQAKAQLAKLPKDCEALRVVSRKLQSDIKTKDEQITRQFDQEPLLLADVDKLLQAEGNRAAIAARLQVLQDLLRKATAAE